MEGIQTYEGALAVTRSDTMARRQIADSACIGLAATYTGDSELAREMMEITARALEEDRPTQQLDFPAEAYSRYLRWSQSDRESRDWTRTYLRRRTALYNRPIPSAYSLLRSYAAEAAGVSDGFESAGWIIPEKRLG